MQALKEQKLIISVAVIVLNIVRCPQLLTAPRFFAEEGTTYFADAFHNTFFGNILSAHYGYYTLFNQIATSLATLPPLEYAPLVTTMMCLLLQIGISLYFIWGDIPLLDTMVRRGVMAIAVPLLSWPGHWLTIIGAQCWLGVGTFILLISSDRSRNRYNFFFKVGYLILAGLTGVVSCFLLPAYLLRSIREKSARFFGYATILMLCFILHLCVLLDAILSGSSEMATRFINNSFNEILGKSVVYEFAIPFTGRKVFELQPVVDFGSQINASTESILGVNLLIQDLFMIPVIVGVATIFMTMVILWQNKLRLEAQMIGIALISVTVFSNFCSVNSVGGPRYYFLPSLMLLTLYVSVNNFKNYRPIAVTAIFIVCSTLLANGFEYRSIMRKQAYDPGYPDWRTELLLWQTSPSYQINIWPSSWKMNLDKNITCSRI